MPQPLRVIDNERPHARDIARRAVKEFRLDRDDPECPLPVSNQVHSGAPRLAVDEVIKRTERDVEPEPKKPMRFRGYLALALAMAAAAFTALVVIAEAVK